jgi:hypothetical protein
MIIGLGTLLAAWPGQRRNPIDPVSAPIAGRRPHRDSDPTDDGETDTEREPLTVG